MTQSNQDLINYQNSIKTQNTNVIDSLTTKIIDLQDQITISQQQIVILQNNNIMIDETIAYIPLEDK